MKMLSRLFAFILAVVLPSSCTREEGDPIVNALHRLRLWKSKAPFVIVEDPETERYVQFSVRGDGEVFFSFPIRSVELKREIGILRYDVKVATIPSEGIVAERLFISPQEVERLKQVISSHGVPIEVHRLGGTYFDGPIEAYMESLDGAFPEIESARTFIDDVFRIVYELPIPESYVITEN